MGKKKKKKKDTKIKKRERTHIHGDTSNKVDHNKTLCEPISIKFHNYVLVKSHDKFVE